jgi:homoserine O-acetyltransferase
MLMSPSREDHAEPEIPRSGTRKNRDGGVGLVETLSIQIDLPPGGFRLQCGQSLPELTVAYETYGALSPRGDNAVYICHALTGDAHVAGYHDPDAGQSGWWDGLVGPDRAIDTRYYFVICANILGGCQGTTGPSSNNPATGRPYGSAFPRIAVADIVAVQRLLLKQLGIERLAAVIGGSVGGMQVLEWIIDFPEMVDRAICIASGANKSAQGLAFDAVGRSAIRSDPDWQGGDYYGTDRYPHGGLSLARKIGHITYLSQEMMTRRFGRERNETRSDFQVESYLEHQGQKFIQRFDANSYLRITEAMDDFDLVERYGSLEKAFEPVRAKVLVVALSSDWLFPPDRSVQLANALLRCGKRVSYCLLPVRHGHDAFLADTRQLSRAVRAFLPWIRQTAGNGRERPWIAESDRVNQPRRDEYGIVSDMVETGSRVLDLGCGNGKLLSTLTDEKRVSGLGIDIDIDQVIDVLDRGHEVFQGDIDGGLAAIPDGVYDYAVLSQTLQVVRRPRFVLREMLRVARYGIVSFPNFGKWHNRLELALTGRVPGVGAASAGTTEEPDTHLFTVKDFKNLCRQEGIDILDMACIPGGRLGRRLVQAGLCNLGADRILAKIARARGAGRAAGCRRGDQSKAGTR